MANATCTWVVGIGVAAFVLFIAISWWMQARINAKVEREGLLAVGRVVFAEPGLYKKSVFNTIEYAQVVFTMEPEVSDLEGTLSRWAERLLTYRPPPSPTEAERMVGSVLATQIPYFGPIQLPDEVTGGLRGYTVTLRVYRRRLPEGKLNQPIIQFKVLFGNNPEGDGVFRSGEAVVIDQPRVPPADGAEPSATPDPAT